MGADDPASSVAAALPASLQCSYHLLQDEAAEEEVAQAEPSCSSRCGAASTRRTNASPPPQLGCSTCQGVCVRARMRVSGATGGGTRGGGAHQPHAQNKLTKKIKKRLLVERPVCSSAACAIFSVSALAVKLTAGRVPLLEVCLVRSVISWALSVA